MKTEYGRSLIEIIGVMAIGAIMTASAVATYKMIRNNQIRRIAVSQIEQTAKNVKILLETRGDYSGVSVDYLVKAGALDSDETPIGTEWTITSEFDGQSFSINLMGLSSGECAYMTSGIPTWTNDVRANGISIADGTPQCFSSQTNYVSFVVM